MLLITAPPGHEKYFDELRDLIVSGLLTPRLGSSVPGLILAVGGAINFGSRRTCFPAFYHDATFAD
jgi:hypothetical protein